MADRDPATMLIYEQLYRPTEPNDPLPDPDTSSTTRRLWVTAERIRDALTAAGWHAPGRCLQGIAEAAIAYVEAPEGSDDCVARWYELKGAVEHLRAVDERIGGGDA